MARPAPKETGQKERGPHQAFDANSSPKFTSAKHYRPAFPFVTIVSLLHVLALFLIPALVAMGSGVAFDVAIAILTSQSVLLAIWVCWRNQAYIWIRLILVATYPWIASGVIRGYRWQFGIDEQWVLAMAAMIPALLSCGAFFITAVQLRNPLESPGVESSQFGIKHILAFSAFIATWLAFVRRNSALEISEYLARVEYHALLILCLSCVTTFLCWATLANFRAALPLAFLGLIASGVIITYADETLEAVARFPVSNCYWINLASALVTFLPFRWEGYRLVRVSDAG